MIATVIVLALLSLLVATDPDSRDASLAAEENENFAPREPGSAATIRLARPSISQMRRIKFID